MAFTLFYIITFLAAIASGGGLLLKELYQDNAFVKIAFD